MDFFYRFRFVFIGAAVAAAGTITTLDLTKGSITESSKFEISYTYGEEIAYSGSAFMGNVTFEFRRVGDELWSEEEPHRVGQYEARGKSMGNHGYKYTDISTFEIKPYEATINLLNTSIDFGNDHPDLTYTLLPGDSINDKEIDINYDSLETRTTFARIDVDTIKVTDKDGEDITDCYHFTTEDKEITFNQAVLKIDFIQDDVHTYNGQQFTSDQYVLKSREPFYNAHIECTGGISEYRIGKHDNTHVIRVIGEDGVTDYTENYDIRINDNYIEIEAAPAVTITTKSLNKTYDAKPFEDFSDPTELITVEPGLIEGHHFKLINCVNEDKYQVGSYDNSIEYDIVDDNDVSVDRTLYKGFSTNFGKLTITKRNLNYTTSPEDFIFDNRYHSKPQFDVVDGLADGDEIVIVEEDLDGNKTTSLINPTSGTDNVVAFEIMHGEDNVKDCYNLFPTYNKITITVTPLRFVFTPVAFEYDGNEHAYYYTEGNDEVYTTPESHENAAILDESFNKLPDGWIYDVHIPNSFKIRNVKDINDDEKTPSKEDVVVRIYDNSEPRIDVSSIFINGDYLTFDMPKSSISQKRLNITVKDYTKQYDNKNLSEDVVIDPNDPDTCVTYEGLVEGDLPDVDFLSGANNRNANDGEGQDPYSISLSYGVKDSHDVNLSDNYDMKFKNDKKTIDATITKKDIIVTPSNVGKTYDGGLTFTPDVSTNPKEAINENLIGEKISLNDNLVGTYKTTDAECGTYEYDLDPKDVVVKINGVTVTNNYNIHFEKKGSVTISERSLNISYTNNSKPGGYIFYDKEEHGVFMKDDGSPSSEINISGLADGHRVYIGNTFSTSTVGDVLDISSYEDLGIIVKDTKNDDKDVTDNYIISHTSFHIDIVQTKVTINANTLSKTYDGQSFELDAYKNFDYGEYYSYSSTNIKNAYSVTIQSTTTGNKLQDGHELRLTKYSKDSADVAIDAGWYQLDFDYKIVETSTGKDVSDLYNVSTNSGDYSILINKAKININCNSLGEAYNGQNITAPTNGETFTLTTDTKASAYIASSTVGPRFSERFSLTAQFDDGGYDPDHMYAADIYSFNVTITINDTLGGSYGMNDNSNITIVINKSTYDHTITKCQLVLTTTGKSAKTGKELRSYTGDLAPGDKIYFGRPGGVELLEAKRKVYTYDLDDYVIIHEADGSDVTTTCYDVSVSVG